MDDGVRRLLERRPASAGRFEGSEWPLPVSWAFHAGPPDLGRLRDALHERADDEIKKSLPAALCLAEAVESLQPDRGEFFIDDDRARAYSFRGAKWRAGWACLVGRRHHRELARRLRERRFMVFSTTPGEEVDVYLGPRPTALVYFAQLMVRYGFVYGPIEPGADHELAHFLERDVPGVMVVAGEVSPVEALLALGLMYLGLPAVVPRTFPYANGRRIVAEDLEQVLDAVGRFPNLRVRKTVAGLRALPDFCDPAHRGRPVESTRSWGGSPGSWFCARPAPVEDGIAVEGPPGPDLGVLVELGDPRADELVTEWLERVAATAPAFIDGVGADLRKTARIDLADHARVTPEMVAEAIRGVLRHRYPRLTRVRVTLTFDRGAVDRLRPEIERFKARRRAAVERLSDRTVDEVYACIDCQTFSHGHVCFLTPSRPSMCGTRPFLQAMAAARFGDILEPWHRAALGGRPHQQAVRPGRCLDPERGEYEGLDRAARELSGGILRRVFLHDLRDFPHTSCGCFWAIAFYLPEVDGVGIMTRDYRGRAPGGHTWITLANRAGGKQSPGMAGIGKDYIRSPEFLRGHGGVRSVVWASAAAWEVLRLVVPADQRIAVDEEATTIDALRRFLGR